MTTVECKINKKKFLSEASMLLQQSWMYFYRDSMHEPSCRKGWYRTTQKVPLIPVFGLRTGESTEFLLLLGYAYLYRKHNYLFGTFSLLLKKPPHCYFYSCFKCGQNWSLQAETLEVWIAACQGSVWEDCTESTGGRGEWKEKEWEEILDLQTYCKDRRTSKKILKNETKKAKYIKKD